jgi:hypothetical protein
VVMVDVGAHLVGRASRRCRRRHLRRACDRRRRRSYGVGVIASLLEELLPVVSEVNDQKRVRRSPRSCRSTPAGRCRAVTATRARTQRAASEAASTRPTSRAAAARTVERCRVRPDRHRLERRHRGWCRCNSCRPASGRSRPSDSPLRGHRPRAVADEAADALHGSRPGYTSSCSRTATSVEIIEAVAVRLQSCGGRRHHRRSSPQARATPSLEDIAVADTGSTTRARPAAGAAGDRREAVIASRDFITEGQFCPRSPLRPR